MWAGPANDPLTTQPPIPLTIREVRGDPIELPVCARRQAALEALLELVAVQSSGQVLIAQQLRDRVAVPVVGSRCLAESIVGA